MAIYWQCKWNGYTPWKTKITKIDSRRDKKSEWVNIFQEIKFII